MDGNRRVRAQLTPDAFIEDTRPEGQRAEVKRGRGRPPGAVGKLSREAVEHAKSTGELPHIFLLRVARGEIIEQKIMNSLTGELSTVYVAPPFEVRVDVAKAVAPYFQPKLAAVEFMQGQDDDQLDDIIRTSAAACGIGLGVAGEGEEGSGSETESGAREDSWI